jgi:GntR family transcriptional repressor for pyruvate dehydrogenase complex
METLNNFSEIKVDSPVDIIIRQIRDQITSGQLRPGDKLPSERLLSERLGVGRTQLRDALRKMEFYGILKTRPQSGTVVAGLGLPALQSLISDMLQLQGNDFKSLVESRIILERNIVQLAALNRTDEDLEAIELAMDKHEEALRRGDDAIGEDFIFHLKIADACKNTVLKSLMLIITPEIVEYFKKHNICAEDHAQIIGEHNEIYRCIADRRPMEAGDSLNKHLAMIANYVQNDQ